VPDQQLLSTVLSTGWTLRCTAADQGAPPAGVARPVPATVPGCVHTDLLAAGLIDDPYLDRNEAGLGWIGESDWSYTTLLPPVSEPAGRADRIDLVLDGLDTVADVLLDGAALISTRNMHRGYRVDVTRLLTGAPQELEVRFGSPLRHARAERDRLGPLPSPYPLPFNFIRKVASNFGWDWGPSLVTSGIWKPVRLESWSTARLASVRPQVGVDAEGRGTVLIDVELERAGTESTVLVRAEVAGVHALVQFEPGSISAQLRLSVPEPALWWPRGHGEQPLHDLTVTLLRPDQRVLDDEPALDSWSRRIGFRSVVLDVTPDQGPDGRAGTPFTFRINGKPISVQGANWIPDDCFPARVTTRRYRDRIEQAVAANVNLLRVWGGGRYESEDFYSACDELGVLTWQDFLFACAAYPEDPGTAAEIEAEARQNVGALMGHPSLVLWNGNNENLWGHEDWDWKQQLDGRPWGLGYYTGLLPRVMAETDPSTPYWPGSPWSGSADRHPNDPAHGNLHIWDVWNQVDYTAYRDYRPRFVSEFGYQGPPAWSTLTRAIHDRPLGSGSPGMRAHQKADDGDLKLERGLLAHFGVPEDFADWHWLTQLNQARAVQLGVEHFRSLWPHCTGSIVWQLNDCWPVTSWAAIDGDGRRKPLWYALRAAFAPRLITVQPRDGDPASLAVIAVNDTDRPWTAELIARRVDVEGSRLGAEPVRIDVPARSTGEVLVDPVGDQELLVVDGGPRRALWAGSEDKDLGLPRADLEATAGWADGVARVRVTARTLLRDLSLFPDRLAPAAEVDDLMITLLPGESHEFTVTGLDPALDVLTPLTSAPILRTVNDALPKN
jgi:beta-mannosidase